MSCSQCGADDPAHQCADCLDVYYCSSKCQIAHWTDGHATECQARVGNPMSGGRYPSSSGIRVTGVASMTRSPKLAVLSLSVGVTHVSLAEAREEAAREMVAVREALSLRSIKDDDVVTTDYSIQTVREDVGGVWKQVGFRVNNSIRVTTSFLNKIGKIMDAAVAVGDNIRVDGIHFTLEDPEKYAATLRAAAAKDARERATQIAEAMNERLGGLISATEVSGGRSRAPRMMMAMASDAPTTTPISSGDIELRAEVQAMFSILSI